MLKMHNAWMYLARQYDANAFEDLRDVPLIEAAIALARSGKVAGLTELLRRHPYALTMHKLDLLSELPETLPLSTYVALLPAVQSHRNPAQCMYKKKK